MENEEITVTLSKARELASRADKQGYMRGVEDALSALPKKNSEFFVGHKCMKRENDDDNGTPCGQNIYCDQRNSVLSQARDAISKLKEV